MNHTTTTTSFTQQIELSRTPEDLFTANQIVQHLGGKQIYAFIGVTFAKSIKYGAVLEFEARGNNEQISALLIKLNAMDLYDMHLGYINHETNEFCTVKEINGLYNDMLCNTFEKETGLCLHF